MDINRLLERSNRLFELLEYTNLYDDYDEIVSLKISINNLLVAVETHGENFFEVLLLSSPVLFDFAFNSKIDSIGERLRISFERNKDYDQAKKWYKFVRNSLIHTNRYTYNNFLSQIYRIEYNGHANIYFELDTDKIYRFEEFKQNRFFIANEDSNAEDFKLFEIDNNIRICVNYEQFKKFVFEQIELFVRSVEHEVDHILDSEVIRWQNYANAYHDLVIDIYETKFINFKLIRRLVKSLKKINEFDLKSIYILCEFLVYFRDYEEELNTSQIEDIITITTYDKYAQIDNRTLLINEISDRKTYLQSKVVYSDVIWIVNELHPINDESDNELNYFEHTNYLIMYMNKYLKL